MKPIDFEGANIVFGKNQPEYQPLPAKQVDNNTIMTCWELSDDDILLINSSKKIWLGVKTFGNPLQPVLLTASRTDIDETL